MSGIWTLTIPLLPKMPAAEECGCPREILPEGFEVEWVGGVGLAEARDAPCGGWRVYQRFFRPRPGTEPTFRVNRIATDLLRLADSTLAPVYERVVIVGLGPGGRLAHVPHELVTHARQLWERYATRRSGIDLYPTAHLQVAAGS
jgi:hypothetical protein